MRKIYKTVDELVGNTPLLELGKIKQELGLNADIYAKLEYFNPAGSIKDRAALSMLNDAERRGILTKDTVIIEPTSGNTGIGLAALCAARGYKLIIVMPDSMSVERQKLMVAYGAELVLTDGSLGMKGAIARAEELKAKYPSAIIAGQFTNPANPTAHYETTGREIFEDTEGELDILVATVGTGGTITGTARFLKEKKPSVRVVAVEPAESPVLSGGASGSHKIQGIGAGFIPDILDTSIYDEVVTVTAEESFESMRLLGRGVGVLVGISSGAALSAALKVAKREENRGKKIVVILPDTGERYLSSEAFQ